MTKTGIKILQITYWQILKIIMHPSIFSNNYASDNDVGEMKFE